MDLFAKFPSKFKVASSGGVKFAWRNIYVLYITVFASWWFHAVTWSSFRGQYSFTSIPLFDSEALWTSAQMWSTGKKKCTYSELQGRHKPGRGPLCSLLPCLMPTCVPICRRALPVVLFMCQGESSPSAPLILPGVYLAVSPSSTQGESSPSAPLPGVYLAVPTPREHTSSLPGRNQWWSDVQKSTCCIIVYEKEWNQIVCWLVQVQFWLQL